MDEDWDKELERWLEPFVEAFDRFVGNIYIASGTRHRIAIKQHIGATLSADLSYDWTRCLFSCAPGLREKRLEFLIFVFRIRLQRSLFGLKSRPRWRLA